VSTTFTNKSEKTIVYKWAIDLSTNHLDDADVNVMSWFSGNRSVEFLLLRN
jgi:hypothetical protein